MISRCNINFNNPITYISVQQDVISGKTELLFLSTSFVFFVIDVVTDIAVVVKYHKQGHSMWFSLTVLFIVAPYLVSCIMVAVNTNGGRNRTVRSFLYILASLVSRYIEEFTHWKRRYLDNPPCEGGEENCNCPRCGHYRQAVQESKESAYNTAWLHYVETITESVPQWCLQVYIMLHNWNFPRLTVISTFFSFFSLPLSVTRLEKARVTKNDDDFKFCPQTVMFFTCQMFTLLSRLSTIVILAYTWRLWFSLFLFLHWSFLNYIYLSRSDMMRSKWCIILFCIISPLFPLTFPFLFHPIEAYHNWLSKERKAILPDNTTCHSLRYKTLFAIISVENIVFTLMAVSKPIYDAKHMDVISPIALPLVVFGAILSTILSVVYYRKYNKPPKGQYLPIKGTTREEYSVPSV